MSFFNLNKNYIVYLKCDNCGKRCEIKIRKGISIREAIEGKMAACDYCGCSINPKEYSTEFIK